MFVLTLDGTKGKKHRDDIVIENMTIRQNPSHDCQLYVRESVFLWSRYGLYTPDHYSWFNYQSW